MTATFSKTAYVVGEPIRVEVTLENQGQEAVRILDVSELTSNMDYVHMEIQPPEGGLQLRRSKWIFRTEILMPGYIGEPLDPGKSILMIYYPNFSRLMRAAAPVTGDDGTTFPVPGRYSVRFVYESPDIFENIVERRVESNETVLTFRSPDAVEAEILFAVRERSVFLAMEEWRPSPISPTVETALRDVIRRYPGHQLTVYAMLALANGLADDRAAQAQVVLAKLATDFPGFRPAERAMLIAQCNRALDTPVAGRVVLDDFIRERPAITSNYSFMWEYFVCRYPHATGANIPVEQWRLNRINGVDNPVEATDASVQQRQ